ncbi:MAG: CIA30 family protein [Acidobacteria bacterium]|nr:CIA30 family protein [Acidobacteriota bacterium]
MSDNGAFIIDDFSLESGMSLLGTRWVGFTDQVMGGVSSARYGVMEEEGRRFLRLQGRVSLENNGGFVQVALSLVNDGRVFDASAYTGIRLRVRGNGEGYYIHLRTRDCLLPWQYYAAPFTAGLEWRDVVIPFNAFTAASLRRGLDTSALTRIAVVGAKREFEADVAMARLEFVGR